MAGVVLSDALVRVAKVRVYVLLQREEKGGERGRFYTSFSSKVESNLTLFHSKYIYILYKKFIVIMVRKNICENKKEKEVMIMSLN